MTAGVLCEGPLQNAPLCPKCQNRNLFFVCIFCRGDPIRQAPLPSLYVSAAVNIDTHPKSEAWSSGAAACCDSGQRARHRRGDGNLRVRRQAGREFYPPRLPLPAGLKGGWSGQVLSYAPGLYTYPIKGHLRPGIVEMTNKRAGPVLAAWRRRGGPAAGPVMRRASRQDKQ